MVLLTLSITSSWVNKAWFLGVKQLTGIALCLFKSEVIGGRESKKLVCDSHLLRV